MATKKKSAKKWIPKDLKKGQLHKDLKVPEGKEISASKLKEAAKQKGVVGKRARFALIAAKFKKGKK